MALNFYDAIVLGMDLPALLTAALMARRGLRLLVLGQSAACPPPTYAGGPRGDLVLPRGPSAYLAADSAVLKRVFSELALLQLVKRRLTTRRPAFQLALPGHRLDVVEEKETLLRELAREFPPLAEALGQSFEALASADEELDLLFSSDLVLPPDRWGERREISRALSRAPLLRTERPLLPAGLPADHPAALALLAPLCFGADLDVAQLPWMARVRVVGHFLRGAQYLSGGLDGLRALLLDRIRSSGGELREKQSAATITVRRGRAEGVTLGDDDSLGAHAVVSGLGSERTLDLLGEERPRKWAQAVAEMEVVQRRYTLNLVLDQAGLPEGMGQSVFSLARADQPPTGANLLWLQLGEAESSGSRRVVSVSCLCPGDMTAGDARLPALREAVSAHLATLMPFHEPHLIAVDSPHEAQAAPLPAAAGKGSAGGAAGGTAARGGRPFPLPPIYRAPDGFWGVGAINFRSPIKGLYLVGRQVLPGLGFEGDFLTAWSVARVVLESSGRKDLIGRQVLLGGD
jgi:phytoene dehydrogenase-like protein